MNVLFLDDDAARLTSFRSCYPSAMLVTTAAECVARLQDRDRWDNVFLDHDLGGETYVDSDREDCGMEVVRWIVENKPEIGRVIAHTCNEPAGLNMIAKLRDVGYSAEWVPFPRLSLEQ